MIVRVLICVRGGGFEIGFENGKWKEIIINERKEDGERNEKGGVCREWVVEEVVNWGG